MRSIEWWHFQWPWRTHNPVGFQDYDIFEVEYLKKRSFLGTNLLKNTNSTKSIEWYDFQWPWLALDWEFKVAIFVDIEYLRNDTR